MKIMTEHIPEQIIPAHDCVTELYKFDELDEEIRERLLDECAETHASDWEDEWRDTLKAVEELFGVTCKDWSVYRWSHDYTLYAYYGDYSHTRLDEAAECDAEEYGYLGLKGLRAMGKCWTRYGRKVVKGEYYSGPCHGTPGRDFHCADRHSKVLFVGLHDGSCPLTGYIGDNDALDPLWVHRPLTCFVV